MSRRAPTMRYVLTLRPRLCEVRVTLRRRLVGPISLRQLESDRDVGSSSSYRDVRSMVRASARTKPVRGAGGR